MKRIFSALALTVAFATTAMAMDEVPRPELQIGSSWTFKRVDMYTGIVKDTWKQVVENLDMGGYHITRYSESGAVLTKYRISKNLGQGSRTRFGKIGDGNLYDFPLTDGKSWTTVNHWVNGSGQAGFDETTYTVVGRETVNVEAGKFDVVKITGVGKWVNETQFGSARIENVLYYSPQVQASVRSERIYYSANGEPPNKDIIELKAYDLK